MDLSDDGIDDLMDALVGDVLDALDPDERDEDPEGWEYPSANDQLLDAADDWSLMAADAALPWVDSARVTGDDNPF